MTGHEDPAKPETAIRWAGLANGPDTLIFLMGVENLEPITESLLRHGRPAGQPAAAIRWATTPDQEVVVGTLGDIVERVRAADLRPPAVLVVVDVVGLRDALDWRARLPLAGLRVLVTRARQQASALSSRLVELGAVPLEYPTIEIRPSDDPAPYGISGIRYRAASRTTSQTSPVDSAKTTAPGGGTLVKADSSRPCCSRTVSTVEQRSPNRARNASISAVGTSRASTRGTGTGVASEDTATA